MMNGKFCSLQGQGWAVTLYISRNTLVWEKKTELSQTKGNLRLKIVIPFFCIKNIYNVVKIDTDLNFCVVKSQGYDLPKKLINNLV